MPRAWPSPAGSYGGYMVLASLVNFPGRIKAGIDIVGSPISSRFWKTRAAYRQDLRRAEYGDERKPRDARRVRADQPGPGPSTRFNRRC